MNPLRHNSSLMNSAKWVVVLLCLISAVQARCQAQGIDLTQVSLRGEKPVDWTKAKIGQYSTAELDSKHKEAGTLIYKGAADKCDIFALSFDLTNLTPHSDLRLYIRVPSGHTSQLATFPLANRTYVVKQEAGSLNVYADASSFQNPKTPKLLLAIDLSELTTIYEDNDATTLNVIGNHKPPSH